MIKRFDRRRRCVLGAVSVTLLTAMSGCSNSGEDVRVVLCKDVVQALLSSDSGPVAWSSADIRMRRGEDLRVDLGFSAPGGGGSARAMRAVCIYPYDAVEDTALTLADPMSAYSTSPRRVILNGRSVSNPQLAEAVKRAMLAQGWDLLERARLGVESAAQHIGQGLNDIQGR
ncbi:hypothetical protein [Imhoffiella purpurea]|uniref:Lipoprotein n=1 Tax=Imhoffiella purpurea TaxID=1249627 RepID=W9W105_9GAMM|nr:hypothetical protein [Imhoffiella purpurea]EXJ16280.1 hypothetical protein D779_0422 [Imhoffiella purpurea]